MSMRRGTRCEKGFSLLELTIAMAVFAVVLGAAAQALVSYYVAMDTQEQRNTAIHICKGVLNDMRQARDADPDQFPDAITGMWPDDTLTPGPGLLRNETVQVNYVDTNANPLEITVTVSWEDLRGRPIQATMTTLLTDQ